MMDRDDDAAVVRRPEGCNELRGTKEDPADEAGTPFDRWSGPDGRLHGAVVDGADGVKA